MVFSKASVLDLGCGNGRNSLYLASRGFNVLGVDFVSVVFPKISKKLKNNLKFQELDITKKWTINKKFDAIIDCNTTICIPSPGRDKVISSAYEVLKPGGYYLFYGIVPTKFIKTNPGPEPNSTIFSKTGKFEKQYSREELLDSYKKFELVKLEKIGGSEIIEGKKVSFYKWVAIFKKPE
jgi:SAM-dependent methyltransferase